ncbi:MAG: Uma2 family endonuclease [Chloroflexi bacterium]|nr:Uma2 family endonuclease [Chloroflexota bacterium]
MALHVTRRRFTADEYHQMAEAGILLEDDRVELIEGEIVEMSPIGRHHASAVNRLTNLFVPTFADVAIVSVQNPIRLSDDTEPQPDLTLLRPRSDFYDAGHPGPEDILLVVEVADTSVAYDRGLKIPLYWRSGIAESWLIDLTRGTVTVYGDVGPSGYGTSREVRRGEQLAPLAFPDRVLAIADMLG